MTEQTEDPVPPHSSRLTPHAWIVSAATIALSVCCSSSTAAAEPDYPTRPIKFILPVPPGGSVDTMARIMAEKLRQKLGKPFIIENRGGAGGNLAMDALLKAPPDGYTIVFSESGSPATHRYTARSPTRSMISWRYPS